MKVFLVEPNQRYDLKVLDSYGPTKLICERHLNPFNVQETIRKIKVGLNDFDPTEDYLCLTGNLQCVAIMMMVAYSIFDSFKILAFDARSSNYRERLVTHE